MLMVLRRNLGCDVDFVLWVFGFSRCQAIGIDDSGSLDFQLDRTVQRKVEVETILVVCHGTDGRDDQLSIPGDVRSHISEVSVLVENTSVFLATHVSSVSDQRMRLDSLDANGTLDSLDTSSSSNKIGVEIGDAS